MADIDSKWLRKATDLERMFEIGHQNKVYLTHYTLDFASSKPVDEDTFRRALTHLYRKVPVLRVCLQDRNSELWLREMKECNIDLKILKDCDLEKEQDKVTLHTYDSENGPLWCVRVLPISKDNLCYPSQQVGKDFHNRYALIFGIHHSLADGTTNVKICNLLFHILDDLLSSRSINDHEQLGEHTGDEEIQLIYKQEMEKLRNDSELYNNIKRELDEGAKVRPLTRHICQIPPGIDIRTRNVLLIIDNPLLLMFHARAKSEGVTLHSAITGLLNLAFVKLLQESGIYEEEYNIRAGHDINVRRYYSSDSSRVLGIHGPMFGYRAPFKASKDMLPEFWKTVKGFHERFQSVVSKRTAMAMVAYRMMTEDTNKNFQEMFRTDGEPNYYYTISNMGNLDGVLMEEGDSISLRRLTRFSSLRNGGTFMCLYIHSFRGQLNITFAYSTRFFTHDFVRRLSELFQVHMTSVSQI